MFAWLQAYDAGQLGNSIHEPRRRLDLTAAGLPPYRVGGFGEQQAGRVAFDSGTEEVSSLVMMILRHEPLYRHACVDGYLHRSLSSRMSRELSVCFSPSIVAARASASA